MNRHTRIAALLALILLTFGVPLLAGTNAVQPQVLIDIPLYRDVTSISYSTNLYYTQGASILFSNITCYSTGTNSQVRQGLSNVTVEVAMSTASGTTGTWVTATAVNAATGTFKVTYPALPSASTVYWQTRLTDVNTNIYYYQMQMLYGTAHL
jgi:hypothetical protein